MPLPLIYHDDYSPEFPADHRFPMDKFRLLRDHLVSSGLTEDSQLLRPQLCPPEILALAHDPGYIARYMGGELSREDQRRLGLPIKRSPEELKRFLAHAPANILVKYRDPDSLATRS